MSAGRAAAGSGAAGRPRCRTRFVAFYSDIDYLVRPTRNARLDHPDLQVDNIPLAGVGHLSMPNNSQVAFKICSALAELDPIETASHGNVA